MSFLGVEYGCKFVLTGPDGTRAVFNEPLDADFVGVLNPEESSGLDAPEIREDSAERVEGDGAIFGDFFSGKRPIVLGGEISATSKTVRNERAAKLKRASNAKTGNSTLTWEPAGSGQQVQLTLRRQQPTRIVGGWIKKFMVAMGSADSKIVSSTLHTGNAVGIKTGAFSTLPTVGAQEEFNSSAGANGVAWTSPENIKLSDNVYSTVTLGGGAEHHLATDYLIGTYSMASLPSNARVIELAPIQESKINAVPTKFCKIEVNMILMPKSLGKLWRLFSEEKTYIETVEKGIGPGRFDPMTMFNLTTGGNITQTRKELSEAMKTETKMGLAFEYYFPGSPETVGQISMDWIKIEVVYALPAVVEATNNGDVPADSIIKVTGPIVNPSIENETNGEIIYYTGTIEKGETVTFSSLGRTAVSSVFGNVYNKVVFPTNWVKIKPGLNSVALFGESGTSETETKLVVEWRDAWE